MATRHDVIDLERVELPPEARRAILLLARLAGDQRADERLTPAPFPSTGFTWLMHRRIDSLLDANPLQPVYDRIWARQRAALLEALAELERNGVETLTFKGAEFHFRYFPDRALGGMADLDILVCDGQLEAARRVLLALGYRHGVYDRPANAIQWLAADEVAAVEARHYQLAQLMRVEPFEVSPGEAAVLESERVPIPVWRGDDGSWRLAVNFDVHRDVAANVPGTPFFTSADPAVHGIGLSMSTSDLVWFTASRYYSEIGASGKRSLRDLAYLIPAVDDALDWDPVVRAAERYALGASLFYPLAFLRGAFGAAVPDEALEASLPTKTSRQRDWGWQLGVLFEFVEPMPLVLPTAAS